MSTTASEATLSPLRPKQVRPHLARLEAGFQPGGLLWGSSLSVVDSTVTQSKLGELLLLLLVYVYHACSSIGKLK